MARPILTNISQNNPTRHGSACLSYGRSVVSRYQRASRAARPPFTYIIRWIKQLFSTCTYSIIDLSRPFVAESTDDSGLQSWTHPDEL